MKKFSKIDVVRWILLGLIAVTNVFIVTNPALSFLVFLLPITFALLHSFSLFGKKHTLVIFAIIMVVSFLAEYIGVHTGKLFGEYYYNNDGINGFLVGGVPPFITFSYVSMGYVCYVLARIILGQYGKLRDSMIVGVSVIAAICMTVWDMSFDPVASYVKHLYIWDGGPYFGVPWLNFTGWFITTFIFFTLISLYLNAVTKTSKQRLSRLFLAEVIVAMAVNAFGIIIKLAYPDATDLEQAMAVVALFGMGMPMAIATFRLISSKN